MTTEKLVSHEKARAALARSYETDAEELLAAYISAAEQSELAMRRACLELEAAMEQTLYWRTQPSIAPIRAQESIERAMKHLTDALGGGT